VSRVRALSLATAESMSSSESFSALVPVRSCANAADGCEDHCESGDCNSFELGFMAVRFQGQGFELIGP